MVFMESLVAITLLKYQKPIISDQNYFQNPEMIKVL